MLEIKQTITNAVANIRPALARSGQVWLAFSGGLDSTVLLHVLKTEGIAVKALHVNHQLSHNADAWQQHCVRQCENLGCEIVVERVDVKNEGKGIEHAARKARYAVFDHYVKSEDILLVAHHLDDECETLLFRLLRGSGLKGVTGIKKERTLGQGGKIMRPLLPVERKNILEYANIHSLSWVEDESNRDIEFDRNYLREMVLPLFQQRWPNFRKKFATSITLLRETEQLLAEYGQHDLAKCNPRKERLGNSIDLSTLTVWSVPRINHVLRQWLENLGYSLPGLRHLEETQKLFTARDDAAPAVQFGECELRRYKNRLYCLPRLQSVASPAMKWNSAESLQLPDGSRLAVSGQSPALWPNLEVKFREGGERCRPQGRDRSQTLKKLLQEYELEPWLRDRVPLIYFNDELIAVGDLWVCKIGVPNTPELAFTWTYPAHLPMPPFAPQ